MQSQVGRSPFAPYSKASLADCPHPSSTLAYARTAFDVLRFALLIGTAESNDNPPRVYA